MKIVYIFSTLAKTGGTERMITEKANYFSEQFGYDVTIITLFQKVEDVNHFILSEKVKQINLGIPYFSQYHYKYPKRLWIKWLLNKQIKKSIKQYVKNIDPDILIGISFFKANHISKVKCKAKIVIESHEAKMFTHSEYGKDRPLFARIFNTIRRFNYFKTIERNADVIVTLTEGDKKLWKRAKRVEIIPNYSTMSVTKHCDCTSKRVIAVGRLEWEKGFGRLIEAWNIVSSRHSDWHLDIFGEGSMNKTLKAMTSIYKAKNLTFHNVTSNISQEYANSSICVVSSYFEGFSLILLEAMRHGVPCVAFDCPFGPGYIIDDARDGFLVDNGDIRLFAERICQLIENEDLRKIFSTNALEKANTFNVDLIMNKWKELFEQMI